MSGVQYWTILYQYIRSLFMEISGAFILFSIVNMAPVCLLLPYMCNVCTLLNLNLNMNFSMIYFTKI